MIEQFVGEYMDKYYDMGKNDYIEDEKLYDADNQVGQHIEPFDPKC